MHIQTVARRVESQAKQTLLTASGDTVGDVENRVCIALAEPDHLTGPLTNIERRVADPVHYDGWIDHLGYLGDLHAQTVELRS